MQKRMVIVVTLRDRQLIIDCINGRAAWLAKHYGEQSSVKELMTLRTRILRNSREVIPKVIRNGIPKGIRR